jgi:hypothetical protein
MKFKVSWWIHGAGRITRGWDIIESNEELDEDDVENLINSDLERNCAEVSFTPNLPNFHSKHAELMCESRHTEVSNWGIIQLRKLSFN